MVEIKGSLDAAPFAGSGAGACIHRRGGGAAAGVMPGKPAVAGVGPVTLASVTAIDLTDSPSPPPLKTRGDGLRMRRKTTPLSEKPRPNAAAPLALATMITPNSVPLLIDDGDPMGLKYLPSLPSPP